MMPNWYQTPIRIYSVDPNDAIQRKLKIICGGINGREEFSFFILAEKKTFWYLCEIFCKIIMIEIFSNYSSVVDFLHSVCFLVFFFIVPYVIFICKQIRYNEKYKIIRREE